MKKISTVTVLLALGIVFVVNIAHARRVDRRERRQQGRIGQGIRSGELTRGETRKLEGEQRRIQRAERRMKKDGITAAEKAKLEGMQDRASKHNYQEKHDDQHK